MSEQIRNVISFFFRKMYTKADTIWEIDFREIQEFLEGTVRFADISFSDLVNMLLNGDISSSCEMIFQKAVETLVEEVVTNQSFFFQILCIAIFSTLFTVFVSIFENSQIADTGFYISYLLLITFLMASMTVTIQIAVETIETLTSFMKVFIPAFAVALTFSSGSTMATIYYESIFLLSYGAEYILCYGMIPIIRIQMLLGLVNNISKEDVLSKLQQLLKTICDWSLRTILTAFLGVQALQNLIVPSVYNVKASILQKVVSAIPGIGNGAQSITDLVLGGGAIIKNGVGVAALIFIVLICITPLVKLALIYFMFQITTAIVQSIADSRMINGIQCGAECCSFLIRCVFLCGILFFITIVLTCFATGRGGS